MSRSALIKDTTPEQREAIVRQGLNFCREGSCDFCGSCSLGVGSIEKMYQPYIDGKLDLAEVNMLHAAVRFERG